MDRKTEMEHFEIDRADSCIWLTDKRNKEASPTHLTPSQAKEIGEALIAIATKE